MSVYVDILPDGCNSCVCNDDYWKCGINRESISHDGRREDCPLIEIVRCKDCINNDANCSGEENWCYKFGYAVDDDGYCNYGEKQVTSKLNNPDDSLVTEDSSDCKEQKSKLESDLISRQAAINAVKKWFVEEYNSMPYEYDEEVKDNVFTDMKWVDISLEHNKGIRKVLKSLPPVEPKIYGNEHNCIMTIFGECSYSETGCGSCAVVEKVRDALAKTQMKTQNSNENSNEDAISRADTIKAMCADCEAFFGDDTNCADCDNVAVVKSMPPVEPERPKGRWIDIDLKPAPNGVPFEKCENCREWSAQLNKNFCPNCGADMSRYER